MSSTLAGLRATAAAALNQIPGFQSVSNADGWVLPATMTHIFEAGKQNDVPVLIGSNADEGSIFTPASTTAASFHERVQRRFGAQAGAYLVLYPFTSDEEARRAQAASMRDETFGWEMRTWARLQTRTGSSKVYLYYFSHVPPLANRAWLGAQHGAEIPYVLNWPNGQHSGGVPWTADDRALAAQVSQYWINFATSGNPNGPALPTWPAFEAGNERALGIGDRLSIIAVPHGAALDFVDAATARMRAAAAAR